MEASGAGWRQRSDTDSAVKVQTPQSITTRREVGQLHLETQTVRQTERLIGEVRQRSEVTSGGRGMDEGLSSPSWSHTQKRSLRL